MDSSHATMHPGIAARIGRPLLAATLVVCTAFDSTHAQRVSARSDSISLTDLEIDIPSYVALAGERFVLVSGPAQYLGWVDLETRRATRLARTGEGPGEFSAIGAVFGCSDAAGWIDRNLRRIVWLSPETGQYVKQLALPSDVAVFGLPVSATCKDGAVWFALESRTYGKAAVVTDTVRVFRTSGDDTRVQRVATVLGSTRYVRAEGSLTASLRAPWTAHQHTCSGSRQMKTASHGCCEPLDPDATA